MADGLAADAFAKVNLGLVVGSRAADGYHPLISLAQSVSWADRIRLRTDDEDRFTADGMTAEDDNLAWRAVTTVRQLAGWRGRVSLHLEKNIAVAAGLGGGSADAAAALSLAAELCGFPADRVAEQAPALGADVPFCLTGGLALLEGRGDIITSLPVVEGYALGIVVPPVELPTPEVYRRWDALDGPIGPAVPVSQLPPGLRAHEPLRNDLQPAAEALVPMVAEWHSELAERWGRPVAMTGSGPALFAYFLDEDEAASAIDDIPAGARAARAAAPVPRGWRKVPGTLAGPG